jgi:hypothetical protein
MNFRNFLGGLVLLLIASLAGAGSVSATTIDFSTLPLHTAVTTQFPGVTFSLAGPGPGGDPVTGAFDTYGLGNSPTGTYPTSEILDIAFDSGVSNLSFTFSNFGDNTSFGLGPSFYYAYSGATLISSGNIGNVNDYSLVNVAGSGITDLKISNGSGGFDDWQFGVGELTYTLSAVPEPSTWAMMILGFAGIGYLTYRRRGPRALIVA